jgi:hypothetical protein
MVAQVTHTPIFPASYFPSTYCLYIVLKACPMPGGRKKILVADAGTVEDMRRTQALFNERWGTSFHAWLGLPHADERIGRIACRVEGVDLVTHDLVGLAALRTPFGVPG